NFRRPLIPAVRRYKTISAITRNAAMSYIKELWDMYTQIRESISDSATRDLLVPLKEKIVDVEREQLRLEHAVSNGSKQHEEAIAELHAKYGKEIATLQHANSERNQFVEHHGAHFKKDGRGGYHSAVYCGICKSPSATETGRNPRDVFRCTCGWQSSFTKGQEPQIRQTLPKYDEP
ncbi:MAG: hypothetical protein KDA62_12220, partial [Planctomycetales bacterium]|nr:hypothetical protein [Planctomycetales bacterium]